MALCMPTVETVIFRALMPRPQSAAMVRIARVTGLKFASGSPMPMKTTLEMRPTPSSRASRQTCSTIRPSDRFPSSPPRPVAQNLHPTAQPTWLEMQAVRRTGSPSVPFSVAGIITHSVWRAVFE